MITDNQALEAKQLLQKYCKQRNRQCFNSDKTRCPFSKWVVHFDTCDIDSIVSHDKFTEIIAISSVLIMALAVLISVIFK